MQFYGLTYETEDAQPVATKTIYLNPGEDWPKDDAKFAAWAWGEGQDGKWYLFNELTENAWAGDAHYGAEIPETCTSIIIVRYNPDSTPDFNAENCIWNRTENITLGENNVFTITGWDKYVASKWPVQKYNVTVADDQVYGTVEPNKYEAAEGEQVLLKVTPKDNYQIEAVSVIGDDQTPIETKQIIGGENNYSFVMPGQNVTVSATFKAIPQVVGYYVVGNMTGWDTYDEAYKLAPGADGSTLYTLTKEFKAGDEISLIRMVTTSLPSIQLVVTLSGSVDASM